MIKYNVLKSLIIKRKKCAGRGNFGRITVRRRGGGHKRLYRVINFNYLSHIYKVLSNEYDPNRNSAISVVKCLFSGSFDYILTNRDILPGFVIDMKNAMIVNGGRYVLKNIPPNFIISNIEFKPNKGGQLARSSGSFCKVLQKDFTKFLVRIKLPSLEERYVSMGCKATVGSIINNFMHLKKI